MANLKELSLRIKNIKSVQKTAKIMQMVSAAKLSNSRKRLSNSKMYISKLYSILSWLTLAVDRRLLAKILNDVGNNESHLVFVISSDRGMCGNFNSSIVKLSYEHVNRLIASGREVDVVFWGRKAFEIGKNKFDPKRVLKIENSKGVTLSYIESLIKAMHISQYSKIDILYNKFCSSFAQKPILEIIKPFGNISSLIDCISELTADYAYEYNQQSIALILRALIQDYFISVIYTALLESAAAENSARMVAMESVNKSSKEMLHKLTLLYNRSRQATITTNLIEVICGAESL